MYIYIYIYICTPCFLTITHTRQYLAILSDFLQRWKTSPIILHLEMVEENIDRNPIFFWACSLNQSIFVRSSNMVTNPLSCGYNQNKNQQNHQMHWESWWWPSPKAPQKNIKKYPGASSNPTSQSWSYSSPGWENPTALERGCFPVLFRVNGFLSGDLDHLNLTTSTPGFSKTPLALAPLSWCIMKPLSENHT